MSKTAKIISINSNLSFTDKNTGETKNTYDKINHNLVYVPRANNPNKCLSEKAMRLVSNYYNMINSSPSGVIFITHDFISSKTRVGNSQNKRYHNELRDLFDIQYHQSIIIDGKKYRDGFAIQFTENTEIILKNPKLFYSSQSHKNEQLDVQKRTPRCSKMDASLYIEEKENNNKNIANIANGNLNFSDKKPPKEKSHQANFLNKKKTIPDLLPLTEEDAVYLRRSSGREFELRPMNEIALKIHNYTLQKGVPLEFDDKAHFLNYFTKKLGEEKRDAYKINNISFRINLNITPEEKEERTINKYLQEIEYSLQVSPEEHFRKKIAGGVLLPQKAFNFLEAYRSIEIQGDIAKIYLTKEIDLPESDIKIILAQIKATHEIIGNLPIKEIELITPNLTKQVKEMPNINQQILDSFGSVRGQEILNICSISEKSDKAIQVQIKTGEIIPENDKHLLRQCIHTVYGDKVEIRTNQPKSETNVIYMHQRNDANWPLWETRADLWDKFKKGILEQLRSSEGEHIFKAWFDKLQRTQNMSENKLILTGSEFFIDQIANRYESLIATAAKNKKINITLIYEGKEDPGYRPIVFTATEGRKF